MGLLTGKYDRRRRGCPPTMCAPPSRGWATSTAAARHPEWLARLEAIREVLTSGGRTLAQGALGWLLARSPRTVPIPGIRTVAQAEQNAAALCLGPLPPAAMAEIAQLLGTGAAQPQ